MSTLKPLYLNTQQADFDAQFTARLHWSASEDKTIEARVEAIIERVKSQGDEALLALSQELDGSSAVMMAAVSYTHLTLPTIYSV